MSAMVAAMSCDRYFLDSISVPRIVYEKNVFHFRCGRQICVHFNRRRRRRPGPTTLPAIASSSQRCSRWNLNTMSCSQRAAFRCVIKIIILFLLLPSLSSVRRLKIQNVHIHTHRDRDRVCSRVQAIITPESIRKFQKKEREIEIRKKKWKTSSTPIITSIWLTAWWEFNLYFESQPCFPTATNATGREKRKKNINKNSTTRTRNEMEQKKNKKKRKRQIWRRKRTDDK